MIVLTFMTPALVAGTGRAAAQAQPNPGSAAFLNINVGAQPQQRTIATSESFPLYDETATVTSSQPVNNGPVFDIAGGYRVRRQLFVGVGFSTFQRSSASDLVASIPDLIFVDRPRIATASTPDLTHSERGIHVQVLWMIPVNDRIDVVLSAGPSFIRVSQELTATVTVAPRTQSITVVQATESATAIGVNAGFDGTYLFTPHVGAGLFVRYAGGKVDLPSVPDLSVGGFQTGLGLRVRF
jgi:hypothetical protein